MIKNRELFVNQLIKYIDTPVIKVLTGIRRCGKSYLLKILSEAIINKQGKDCKIININFESMEFEQYKNYKSLHNYIIKKAEGHNGKVYILIDEIQDVDQWEKAVRSLLVDLDCDIYITGSNARLLSSELATYLSGRFVELELFPLSFKEYIDFNGISEELDKEKYFYDYIKYGGFPGLHMLPDDDDVKVQYLKGIYNSVILKDVIQRNNIRDSELLERIFRYLMDNIGQIFSAKRIADYLKNQGRRVGVESVYNYIQALEDAMVIYSAKRYDVKGKKILDRMEKYFLTDLGLRYGTIGYREDDISQILENVVYLELRRRGYRVLVGKEGEHEIDFIAEKGNEKLYVQVTYLLASDEVVQREYGPLLSVKDNYKKVVLSMDKFPVGARDGVEWINIIEFLLTE